MQAISTTSCCENPLMVCDSGYNCCTRCGQVKARAALETSVQAFASRVSHAIKTRTYTRQSRFNTKIVSALFYCQHSPHQVHTGLLRFLNSEKRNGNYSKPEDTITLISRYRTNIRKPYLHARTYYESVFNVKLKTISLKERLFIEQTFKEIFYAWNRLNLGKPAIPYCTCLRLIIEEFGSKEARFMARFLRKLKCQLRERRYRQNFLQCLNHIKLNARRLEWNELTSAD